MRYRLAGLTGFTLARSALLSARFTTQTALWRFGRSRYNWLDTMPSDPAVFGTRRGPPRAVIYHRAGDQQGGRCVR